MIQLKQAIADCMARTAEAREAEAKRYGVPVDELDAYLEADAKEGQRAEALGRSGISLPLADLGRIAGDRLDDTEPLGNVQRWFAAELDRPILLLCGAVATGKTVACGWAIAKMGGGSVVHAPELPRRILPTRTDVEMGFQAVNLRTSLLVLDDLGTEPSATHGRWAEAFAIFVEKRIMLGRTIITSNLKKGQFALRYGARVASRLNAHAYVVELKEKASLRAAGGGL